MAARENFSDIEWVRASFGVPEKSVLIKSYFLDLTRARACVCVVRMLIDRAQALLMDCCVRLLKPIIYLMGQWMHFARLCGGQEAVGKGEDPAGAS